MRIGIYISAGSNAPVDDVLTRFQRADERGFHCAWTGQIESHDALTLLALAGRATQRIELGTWVIPTYPRHPVALAQQALTVQAACGLTPLTCSQLPVSPPSDKLHWWGNFRSQSLIGLRSSGSMSS